jgi:hypothetical protein
MPYEMIVPRGNYHVFSCRLATIADRAWRGYSKHDLNWRLEYYRVLGSKRTVADSAFRIVEYLDDRTGDRLDCAFIAILPMNAEASAHHWQAALSQYNFAPHHLGLSRAYQAKSFHCLQSLFIEPDHRHSFALRKVLRESIISALKKQYCGYRQRPFKLYAETSIKAGQELALSQGLYETGSRSAEGHKFFRFDSEIDPASPLQTTIYSLW